MELLLEKQKNILERLVDLLKEEREVLIQEDGRRLMELVESKVKLQRDLESSETIRKEKWGDCSLKEMAGRLEGEKGENLKRTGKSLMGLMNEIRDMQETNMMLTRQSAAYSQRLMDLLQQTVRKGGITYGENGVVANGQGVMASMDKSV